MHRRIIALGQAAAGDDAVGFAVLEELQHRGLPRDIELRRAEETTALIALLGGTERVVLVDAALGARPGDVMQLDIDELADQDVRPVSSHGMSVGAIVELARILAPDSVAPSIHLVAVTIARPDRCNHGLTPAVAAAVGRAADTVLELVTA